MFLREGLSGALFKFKSAFSFAEVNEKALLNLKKREWNPDPKMFLRRWTSPPGRKQKHLRVTPKK